MALFRRRRGAGDEPDPAFPAITARQADRIRALLREALAERGVEVVVHADHVSSAGGFQYGLTNLVAMCRADGRGERAWPAIVRGQVQGLLAGGGGEQLDGLDRDEVLADVHLRVMPTIDVPPMISSDARWLTG